MSPENFVTFGPKLVDLRTFHFFWHLRVYNACTSFYERVHLHKEVNPHFTRLSRDGLYVQKVQDRQENLQEEIIILKKQSKIRSGLCRKAPLILRLNSNSNTEAFLPILGDLSTLQHLKNGHLSWV